MENRSYFRIRKCSEKEAVFRNVLEKAVRKEKNESLFQDVYKRQGLNCLDHEVIFLGDGVAVYREKLQELLTIPFSFAPAHVNRQRAAAVAALAEVYYKEGKIQTAERCV